MDSLNRLRYTIDEKKDEASDKLSSIKDNLEDKVDKMGDKAEEKLDDMNLDIRRTSVDEAATEARRTSIGSMQFDDDELIF